jgi:hypothetical protein
MPNYDLLETSRKATKASQHYDYQKLGQQSARNSAMLLTARNHTPGKWTSAKRYYLIIISPLNELEYDQVHPPVILAILYH